mgnify:CR=1 FL=1
MKYISRYSDTDQPDEQGRWARDVVYKGVSIAWINRISVDNKIAYSVTLHFPTGQGSNPNASKVCYSYESSQEFVKEMWDYFLNQIK